MYGVVIEISQIMHVNLYIKGETGKIDGTFGTTGKFRILIPGMWYAYHIECTSSIYFEYESEGRVRGPTLT